MSVILKYSEYMRSEDQAIELIENICNPLITESSEEVSSFDSIAKKFSKDLKYNFGIIATFGAGIKMMIPVVKGLIEQGTFNFEMSNENIILLCIASVSIAYLEETSNKAGDSINSKGKKSIVTKRDAQTILEELKMRGIGQGIVQKFVKAFQAIGAFFKMLFRSTPYVINGLLDMFGYTSLMLPCMNAISLFVGKYDVTLETLAGNLLSLGVGVGALMAKEGVTWLVNKLKKSLNIKGVGKDLSNPIEIRSFGIIDTEIENLSNNTLIKERS